MNDPYAGYHEANLAKSLRKYRDNHPDAIGTRWEYSNFGAGLLGYTMTKAFPDVKATSLSSSSHFRVAKSLNNSTAVAYDSLVHQYIGCPLGLTDLTVALNAEQQERFVSGYDRKGKQAQRWNFDALVGAGGLRSSLEDILAFGAANVRAAQDQPVLPTEIVQSHSATRQTLSLNTTLYSAMRLSHELHFTVPDPPAEIVSEMGLGWIRMRTEIHSQTAVGNTTTLFWHNGGTAGFSSFIGWEAKSGVVVVVLFNTGGMDTATLGIRILKDQVERYFLDPTGKEQSRHQ
eukprot:scaffold5612_cov150-Amphora_coffeaeformis.AAC.9